jgi:hypothetical protein
MPRHEVGLHIPANIWLAKLDIEIPVRSDGVYLGRLHISQGSVDWIAGRQQRGRRLSWERFAELMDVEGRPFKAPAGRKAPRPSG